MILSAFPPDYLAFVVGLFIVLLWVIAGLLIRNRNEKLTEAKKKQSKIIQTGWKV